MNKVRVTLEPRVRERSGGSVEMQVKGLPFVSRGRNREETWKALERAVKARFSEWRAQGVLAKELDWRGISYEVTGEEMQTEATVWTEIEAKEVEA